MSDKFELPEPIFLGEGPHPYSVKDIADALARCSIPHSTASARARMYAQKGFIATRFKGEGATSARLFGLAEIGVAKVLSNLQDAGVQDHEVLRMASHIGCYTRQKHVPLPKGAPILQALAGVHAGHDWIFRMDVVRGKTGVEYYPALFPVGMTPSDPLDHDVRNDTMPVGAFVSYIGKDWWPLFRPLLAN